MVAQWLALLPHRLWVWYPAWSRTFLCGVCMFSLGSSASSHSPNTCRSIEDSKLPVGVNFFLFLKHGVKTQTQQHIPLTLHRIPAASSQKFCYNCRSVSKKPALNSWLNHSSGLSSESHSINCKLPESVYPWQRPSLRTCHWLASLEVDFAPVSHSGYIAGKGEAVL